MCMTKTHNNIDSHSYRNVHDENPYTKKWIVIHIEICNDKNPFKKKMDSHLYRNVHDKNPYTMKWIVIHTEMFTTKTHNA